MTRSAVRSRLAPPAFAGYACYGWASPRARRLSRHSPKGDGGPGQASPLPIPPSPPHKPRCPLLHKTRHTFPEITPPQRDLHFPVRVDRRLGERLERHVVELPLDHGDRARRDEIGEIARIGKGLFA